MVADKGRKACKGVLSLGEFLIGNEPHVTLGNGVVRHLGQGTENFQIRVPFDGRTDDGLMATPCNAIENHPSEIQSRLEHRTSHDNRGHGTCGLGTINDNDDRSIEYSGQFGCGTGTVNVLAVEKTSVTFDDGQIMPLHSGVKEILNTTCRKQKRIQIRYRCLGRKSKPVSIDIIRTLLEWANAYSSIYGSAADSK